MPPPFLFPETHSTVLPDPSPFFSEPLLHSPLPTNSFFQNFALHNSSNHEYYHPYLIKSSNSSLSASYPFLLFASAMLYQLFVPDITLSSSSTPLNDSRLITSYSDLGITLDVPSSNLTFFLVRGSPFITASVTKPTPLTVSTAHSIVSFSPNEDNTKYTLVLNNTQTWLIYASSPITFSAANNKNASSEIHSEPFSGIIRIAVLPDSNKPECEQVLDEFSSCYPVSGHAAIKKPYRVVYKWQKRRSGELLMLAHPLHLKLLSYNNKDFDVRILSDFKYRSIDGDLVGVVGDSWVLEADHVPVTWYSTKGLRGSLVRNEIVSALVEDVKELNSSAMNTTSSYFYGKLVGRAARLALIAEEVSYPSVVPRIARFLKEAIEPWLEGTFKGNGFLYERKWGGLVTKQGSNDSTADFGFGVYNDHHYHLGYFVYGIAVLAKIDPLWGQKYKPQAYALVTDFVNLGARLNAYYPRLRCFDLYSLHSWASGVTEFEDGRNQESTSEAVNAYYAAALMGLAYGDSRLAATGSTLLAMEIRAAQTWWHVKLEDNLYGEEFARDNRIVGVLWSNKRDTKLWWATAECRECRLSIQVLPLLPVTETLFSDAAYAKELVDWTLPSLKNKSNVEGWKGFTYALQGIYDKENALNKIRMLKGFDDGNSFTNLLWWIHSR